MVKAASESGADSVKLQSIDPDENYARDTQSYKIFRDAVLSQSDTEKIFNYANDLRIDIFTTVGDIETARWINEMNPSAWKVSSSLLTHIPLIQYLGSLSRPLYMSTGIATTEEIDLAVETAKKFCTTDVTLMHCTSVYPTPGRLVNLRNIEFLSQRYELPVGYSDHSLGDYVSCLSVSAGAVAIEKHFTLDPSRSGVDHAISLDPTSFSKMVTRIREAEIIMGQRAKELPLEIQEARRLLLRYLVARHNLTKGSKLTTEDIAIKRTNAEVVGLSPCFLTELIGRTLKTDVEVNEVITFDEVL
jgi:sialic acid synthase SpsE